VTTTPHRKEKISEKNKNGFLRPLPHQRGGFFFQKNRESLVPRRTELGTLGAKSGLLKTDGKKADCPLPNWP